MKTDGITFMLTETKLQWKKFNEIKQEFLLKNGGKYDGTD